MTEVQPTETPTVTRWRWLPILCILTGGFVGLMISYRASAENSCEWEVPMEVNGVFKPVRDPNGYLHLKSPDETRGLRILQLVKIMPSPKTEENACYFFSSEDKEGHRFLSYHYHAESEVTHSFDDVANTLSRLSFENGN